MNNIKNFYTLDKNKLKESFIDSLQDSKFKDLVTVLKIDDDILMKYTSTLMDAAIEFNHCQNCKSLDECPNRVKGSCYTPVLVKNKIVFSYTNCSLMNKYLKDNKYQKNVLLFDVPKEIKNASLKNMYVNDKNRIELIKYIKTFISQYNTEKGLYLHGSFGSGKTYIIAAMFNELAKKDIESAIIYFPEFLRNLKESFDSNYKEKFDYIKKVPLLLIDDIGAENLTMWARDEILATILQYRMDEKLATFFTSNLDLESLEIHLSVTNNKIDKIKARRIIERIKQLTKDVSLISVNNRK